MKVHQLSRPAFEALASGNGGVDGVGELAAAEFSKHVILLQGVVRLARDTGHDQYQLAREGYELLAAAARKDRAAAERVIRYPSVGAWARRTIMTLLGGPPVAGAEPGGLRAVAAAAALATGMPTTIDIPVTNGLAILPSLGAAVAQEQTATLSVGVGSAIGNVKIPTDPHLHGDGWLGLRRIRSGPLDVLLDDLDPHRMPSLTDPAPRGTAWSWENVIRSSWRLLADYHPITAAEIAGTVTVIVPRQEPRSGTASTSSSEAFGAIAMSEPPDPLSCAETFVHEVQHLKLSAVQDLVTLTLPDDGSRYYAPWRDDPRPASGLLQGAYAFLGVSRFWREQRKYMGNESRADIQYARWREAVEEVAASLRASEMLTDAGQSFVDGMTLELRRWRHDNVPAQAVNLARRAAQSHRDRWESSNGRSSVC